jgi:NAD(P)H-dependent FMN reductase
MSVAHATSADDVRPVTLLGVSPSMKPAPGVATTSASRNVLTTALEGIASRYPHTMLLDLRERPVPFFDGRPASERPEPEARFAFECVARAGSLLFSIPAYWCAVSGVFKNLVDLLCGPLYDLDEPRTVFTDKIVGAIVLGADEESARAGAAQTTAIFDAVGARLVAEPIAIANPRLLHADEKATWDRIALLTATLARETLLAAKVGAR